MISDENWTKLMVIRVFSVHILTFEPSQTLRM